MDFELIADYPERHQSVYSCTRFGKRLQWYHLELQPHPELFITDLGVKWNWLESNDIQEVVQDLTTEISKARAHRYTSTKTDAIKITNFNDLHLVARMFDHNGNRVPPIAIDSRKVDRAKISLWLSGITIVDSEDGGNITFSFRCTDLLLVQRPLMLSDVNPTFYKQPPTPFRVMLKGNLSGSDHSIINQQIQQQLTTTGFEGEFKLSNTRGIVSMYRWEPDEKMYHETGDDDEFVVGLGHTTKSWLTICLIPPDEDDQPWIGIVRDAFTHSGEPPLPAMCKDNSWETLLGPMMKEIEIDL